MSVLTGLFYKLNNSLCSTGCIEIFSTKRRWKYLSSIRKTGPGCKHCFRERRGANSEAMVADNAAEFWLVFLKAGCQRLHFKSKVH